MFLKYFARLIDVRLKKDGNGNALFFPWGIHGKGRIIADKVIERKVRRFIIFYYQVSLLITGFGVLFGWIWVLLIASILLTGWFYWTMKTLLSGCPYSEDKLSFREHSKKSSKMFNKLTLWLLLLSSSFFVVASVFTLITTKSNSDRLAGAGGIIFFGNATALYSYMLRLKKT